MRRFLLIAVLLTCAIPANAEDLTDVVELGVTAGFADGPGYAGWAPGVGVSLTAGSDVLRVRGAASWSKVHKTETPGGYSVGGGGGLDVHIGHVILTGGMMYHFTDQAVWTKRVHYASGGVGYRRAGSRRNSGVPLEILDVRLVGYRETFSTYANDVLGVEAVTAYDRRLGLRPWCVRVVVKVGGMFFDQGPEPGAARRQGATFSFGVGVAYRPRRMP